MGRGRRSTLSATDHNSIENVNSLNASKEYWEKAKASDAAFINSIYEDLLALAKIEDNLQIADVGCGTGVLVDKLRKQFPNSQIQGFDFSEAKIEQCRMHFDYEREAFSVHDIYNPLSKKRDILIATEVLEHLEQPGIALRNLISGLNPSGRIFLTVPNGREDTFFGHINFWSPESWPLFLERENNDLVKIKTGLLNGKNYAVITKERKAE